MPSPRLVLSDSAAFTGWRALPPFEVNPLACRHAALSTPSTSGPFSTEESVAATQPFGCAPLDAPMGFGSTRFRCCRAFAPPRRFRVDVSPRGSKPASASPTRKVGGRQGFSALSGSCVRCSPSTRRSSARRRRSLPTRRLVRSAPLVPAPKGGPRPVAFGSDTSRRKHLGRIPTWAPKVRWDASRSARRKIHRVVPRTRRRSVRRIASSSPEGRFRDPARAPKSRRRWFELRLSFLPRSPAYMRERSLAAHSPSPEGDRSSAHRSRVASRGCCVEPTRRTPEGIRANGRTGGHPEVVRYRLAVPADSSKLEGRSRARQSSSSPERPGRDPKIGILSPTRRPKGRRRSAGGAVGAAHPTRRW
jgi:hypothetical protein